MKLKIMNKKPIITDDEIQDIMDFDGLIRLHAKSASSLTKIKRVLFPTGVILLLLSAYFLWPGKKSDMIANKSVQQPEPVKPQRRSIQQKKTKEMEITLKPIEKKNGSSVNPRNDRAIPGDPLKTSAPVAVYIEADPIPGFPKLYEYLNTEVIYPIQMLKDSIQGVESVSFVIDEKGNLGQITIVNSLGKLFDEETIRLLNHMPPWKPAALNGKPVASRISLPLTFTTHIIKKEGQ